jgi:arylsulfatase A-like enzyme
MNAGRRIATLAAFVLAAFAPGSAQGAGTPNVIVLLVDDMGHGDIAAHGNPELKTPNFDRLHEAAVRFTNFAVSPTCSPTRAALLSGRHEFRVSVTGTTGGAEYMNPDVTTLAQLFQAGGYKTGLFGKWHLGFGGPYDPWKRGFDVTVHVKGDKQGDKFDPTMVRNGKEEKASGYREDILFTEAMKFMAQNKDTPFFCYLPTYSPHAPNIAPEAFMEPYRYLQERDIPKAKIIVGHYGQIANVDHNLWRLTTFLGESGLEKNTLLIAMNDNGGTQGVNIHNSGMRGEKGVAWRGGTRAYSFWKLGDRYTPGDRDAMTGHVDVLPTLADLCGLEIPAGLRAKLAGDSLVPLLEDPRAKLAPDRMQVHHRGRWDDPTTWRDHKYAHAVVRWGNYTLVRTEPCQSPDCGNCGKTRSRANNANGFYRLTKKGEWELYDIAADPHQDNDMAGQYPEVVARMEKYYEAWWSEVAGHLAGLQEAGSHPAYQMKSTKTKKKKKQK